MKKTVIAWAGLLCLLPLTQSYANDIEYKLGYEFIPGKFYTPQWKSEFVADISGWSWPAWTVVSSTPSTYEKDVKFSVLFLKISSSRRLTENLSVGFETGLGMHKDGFSNEWGLPGGADTSTVITAEYPEAPSDWSGSSSNPNDCYACFYKNEMTIFLIPVLAKLSYSSNLNSEKSIAKAELGVGAYLLGTVNAMFSQGKRYVKDSDPWSGKTWKKGDVEITDSFGGFDRSIVIPTIQFAGGFGHKITDTTQLMFNFGVGWLQNKKSYSEWWTAYGNNTAIVKDGYEFGGITYNFGTGVKFDFNSSMGGQPKKIDRAENNKLKKKYWKRAVREYNKANYEKAISYWEKILDIDPGHKASLQRIEQAQKAMKNYK